MEWQPIETAPKDGTIILAAWKLLGKSYTVQPILFIGGVWLHGWDEDEDLPLTPTHWMPLPPLPKL